MRIQKSFIIWLCCLVFSTPLVFSQNLPEDVKIWQSRPLDRLLSNYRDSNGTPSRDVFMQVHGLVRNDQKKVRQPLFMASFAADTGRLADKQWRPGRNATALNPDVCIETVVTWTAVNRAEVIPDGRAYEDNNRIVVGGYSSKFNERPVAVFDDVGRFTVTIDDESAGEFPILSIPPQEIVFDPFEWRLLRITPANGARITEKQREYLPFRLANQQGIAVAGLRFEVGTKQGMATVSLLAVNGKDSIEIAGCDFGSAEIVGRRAGYQPALIEGCVQPSGGRVVSLVFKGDFSSVIRSDRNQLVLDQKPPSAAPAGAPGSEQQFVIDGIFNEWHNIRGVGDPEGDVVSYLYPNPDTDILQFKVANDDKHFYFYSRVAGAHGRTGAAGRYYWYTYIDVDADPNTGYPPTRDDNCYFGVAIGDDCEAQFEFVGNRFVKTFFGFTGAGSEQAAMDGRLKLGPSFYSPRDRHGQPRDRYKIEYVNRGGKRRITHDYTEGSSEDIVIALSPDGSEVEMRVEFEGFLWDKTGKPLLYPGRVIDVSVGAEAASDYYGSDTWGADSSPVIYGYLVK